MFEMPENIFHLLTNAALDEQAAAQKHNNWAAVLRLVPFRDGDQWCVLYGEDLQVGIAGFGGTPDAAMWAFDLAFSSKA